MTNRQRERNIAMTDRIKNQENVNVRNKTNVAVNVNDRTRFTNVTRITSNGRTFDRAMVRFNDRRLNLGFHDRIFFGVYRGRDEIDRVAGAKIAAVYLFFDKLP